MRILRSLIMTMIASSAIAGGGAFAGEDGLVLVANIDQSFELNRSQVRNLYMGGKVGKGLKPVALTTKHRYRVIFNTKVLGLTESRIHSYWAQLKFTGRGKPPPEFDEIDVLIAHLRSTPGSVGYMPASIELPDELVVLYRTLN